MLTDAEAHAAVDAKDRRFDGVFFIAVTSTGIYCRCVCPARTPKRDNRRFYPSAAAAEGAGYRPCLLCRPEAAPGWSRLEAGDRLAAAAIKEIEAGALDEASLSDLALRLRVSDRHLRRVMLDAFGASPIAIAQTHRLLTAKRLLRETDLTVTAVAYAAGFQSLRRFNALFLERYRMAPSRVRAQRGAKAGEGSELALRLPARGAFDAAGALAFLSARAVSGVEQVEAGAYRRTLRLQGMARATPLALTFDEAGVTLTAAPDPITQLRPLLARLTTAFDLATDMTAVDAHLARSSLLAPDVAAEPGVRLVCGLDPFEIAVRAVVGQQITVAAARTILARLCALAGDEAEALGLVRVFPTPQAVAALDKAALTALGLTGKRADTLRTLAQACVADPWLLSGADLAEAEHALLALPGIGPWTASYIALRALGDADAFPSGDGVLQATTGLKAKELEAAAEPWRPYRGYAALRLWRRAARIRRTNP